MSSENNVFSRFRTWLDYEASTDQSLEGLVKQANSERLLSVLTAYVRLFFIFWSRRSAGKIAKTDRRQEFTHKTTNEIALDVLTEIEAKPAEAQRMPAPAESDAIAPASEHVLSEGQPPAAVKSAVAQPEIANEFLKQMQEQTKRRDTVLDEETTRLRQREDIVFRGSILAASITIGIVLIGVVLIFLNLVALGVVSGVAGLLPGAGTVILSRLSKDIQTQRQQLLEQRDDNLKVLQAIQATLIIPDPDKRNEAIASLAAKLADQALKSTSSAETRRSAQSRR